jgi:hypothetical protein
MSQEPLLLRSGLTGRVYVVTRYKVLDAEKGRIEAITKHDVTEQFDKLVAEQEAQHHLQYDAQESLPGLFTHAHDHSHYPNPDHYGKEPDHLHGHNRFPVEYGNHHALVADDPRPARPAAPTGRST